MKKEARPLNGRASSVHPVPASGSPMPRLPPRPQDRPPSALFPRQCRPCRGSRRGPKHPPVRPVPASGSPVPRLPPRPQDHPRPPASRVSVDYAAAPAAAPRSPLVRPLPASGSTMPRLPPRPQAACPVGGGFAAVIPQACLGKEKSRHALHGFGGID